MSLKVLADCVEQLTAKVLEGILKNLFSYFRNYFEEILQSIIGGPRIFC